MKAPKNLRHKPILSVNDYEKIDAQNEEVSTDVRALSIGEAQYNNEEISLKVWRNVNNKWSRQSEELPIHRNIDLTILLLGSLLTDTTSRYPMTSLGEEIIDLNKVDKIKDFYTKNENYLKPRLEELKTVLDKFLKN